MNKIWRSKNTKTLNFFLFTLTDINDSIKNTFPYWHTQACLYLSLNVLFFLCPSASQTNQFIDQTMGRQRIVDWLNGQKRKEMLLTRHIECLSIELEVEVPIPKPLRPSWGPQRHPWAWRMKSIKSQSIGQSITVNQHRLFPIQQVITSQVCFVWSFWADVQRKDKNYQQERRPIFNKPTPCF